MLAVVGRKIIPDPEFFRFDERREFCRKYDGYPEFCERKLCWIFQIIGDFFFHISFPLFFFIYIFFLLVLIFDGMKNHVSRLCENNNTPCQQKEKKICLCKVENDQH